MASRKLSFNGSVPRSGDIFIMARVSTNRSRNRYPVGTGARTLSGGEISALTSDPAAGFVETLGLISAAEGRRIMKADEEAQTIAGIAEMKRQLNTTFDEYDTNADETTYRPAYDKTFNGFNGLIKGFSNRNARAELELYKKQNAPAWENSVNDATLNRKRENAYASIENSIAGIKDLNLADVDELADANKRIEDGGAVMGSLGHTPEQVKKWKRESYDIINAQAAQNSIESIKPDLIDAISINNKSEDGYKVLDAATAQLVKDGILTKPEAAETNKRLGDWIDNYVSGRIKAAKDADKLTTMQSYQELSKPILKGELTYDDIDNSGLRETRRSGESVSDAERWRKYIKGSYKDAPTKNAPEGHTVSFAAVYDVITLQLSPKEGYDVLLEARFNDGSITNEQFEWAVGKIENPYSRHVLEDVNATLKSNLEDFNRFFTADDERNKKVNEALLSWVDAQEKPPSKKEMFAMSSAFRAGGGQPYDIGAVIERGGREWEIVGFDNDGEPLVEEIP